jgi:hypothetical protein
MAENIREKGTDQRMMMGHWEIASRRTASKKPSSEIQLQNMITKETERDTAESDYHSDMQLSLLCLPLIGKQPGMPLPFLLHSQLIVMLNAKQDDLPKVR